VTIHFADIRGFTSIAERLPPEDVIHSLNAYLSLMVEVVLRYGGTLDKFIGDAIMALFGAPVSTGNDAERAVQAAVTIQERVARLATERNQAGRVAFEIGIGINTGEVIVGNIGSERRLEYGAIGDPVNLAARLEELNKEYGTRILVSEATYQEIASQIESRKVDRVTVRGRERPLEIYEVLGLRAS
jgi:adenylate cyclase